MPDAQPVATVAGQSIALNVTGYPDVPNRWGTGSIRVTALRLEYGNSRTPDGRHAFITGLWIRENGEVTDQPIDQYYDAPTGDTSTWPEWIADHALKHTPVDRDAVLREAAAAIETEQDREEATELARFGELDHETELGRGYVLASAALLRRLADETQQPAVGARQPDTETPKPVSPAYARLQAAAHKATEAAHLHAMHGMKRTFQLALRYGNQTIPAAEVLNALGLDENANTVEPAAPAPVPDPTWPRRAWDLGLLHKGGDPHHCPACVAQPEPPKDFICPGAEANAEVLANPQPAATSAVPGRSAADTEAHVAPHCDGFPTTCPNPVTVPPAPPQHGGGIRCGCYDEEQPS